MRIACGGSGSVLYGRLTLCDDAVATKKLLWHVEEPLHLLLWGRSAHHARVPLECMHSLVDVSPMPGGKRKLSLAVSACFLYLVGVKDRRSLLKLLERFLSDHGRLGAWNH